MLQMLRLGQKLLTLPRWQFVSLIWILMILKSGIGSASYSEEKAWIAANPFINPLDPEQHYLFGTYLSPFVMWCLRLSSAEAFFYFHLFFAVAFTGLFLFSVYARLPENLARTSFLIFAALPVSSTAYFWCGTDALTLFLMMAVFALPNQKIPIWALGIGVLLGLQDFEKVAIGAFFLGAATWGVRCFYPSSPSLIHSVSFALALEAGNFLGKKILDGLIRHFDIAVYVSRKDFVEEHFLWLCDVFLDKLHISFYASLGAAWLVVMFFLLHEKYARIFGLALMGCFLVLVVALDHSRIFALISFFLLAQFILFNRDLLTQLAKPIYVGFFFCLWLFLPFMWVMADVHFSSFSLSRLLHFAQNIFSY